jgi:hypothetical protein
MSTPAPGGTGPDTRDFLVREFDQAWSHYRHLKNTRSQYLGFFFTVTLAATGAGAAVVRGGPVDHTAPLVLTAVFLVIYMQFATFVYVSVRKMGVVLTYYETLQNTIRGWLGLDPADLSVRWVAFTVGLLSLVSTVVSAAPVVVAHGTGPSGADWPTDSIGRP